MRGHSAIWELHQVCRVVRGTELGSIVCVIANGVKNANAAANKKYCMLIKTLSDRGEGVYVELLVLGIRNVEEITNVERMYEP